jgi:predicted nucleic acid-binding protein
VELINGIGLAAYRGFITAETHEAALAALDDDFTEGRYKQADLLWRATLRRAADLSREHTATLGCRSLDVLHVASAIELEFKQFTTFDSRQQQLARAVGLKLVTPTV